MSPELRRRALVLLLLNRMYLAVLVGALAATGTAMYLVASLALQPKSASSFPFEFSPFNSANYRPDTTGRDGANSVVAVVIDRATGQGKVSIDLVASGRALAALRPDIIEAARRDDGLIRQQLGTRAGGFDFEPGTLSVIGRVSIMTGLVAQPGGAPGALAQNGRPFELLDPVAEQAPIALALAPGRITSAVLAATPAPLQTPVAVASPTPPTIVPIVLSPTQPSTQTPEPTDTPGPTSVTTAAPTQATNVAASPSPAASDTPIPAATPTGAPTPAPAATATLPAVFIPAQSPTTTLALPANTPVSAPTAAPLPTNTPQPANTAVPTNPPSATDTPVPAPTAAESSTSIPTSAPISTSTPVPMVAISNGFDGLSVISASNMLPGSSVVRTVTTTNVGTLPFTYTVTASASGGVTPLWSDTLNGLRLRIRRGVATLYDGSIQVTGLDLGATLNPGQTDTLELTVYLPTTAGNDMQALAQTILFSWTATG